MKTMTCRQTGGPCGFELRGENHDAVINDQGRHLEDAVQVGEASHQAARDEMKSRWRHPKRSVGWYRDVQATFAGLPDA